MDTISNETLTRDEWNTLVSTSSLSDLIEVWHTLPESVAIKYFLHTDKTIQADFLLELSTDEQETLITKLASKNIKELLQEIAPDDLVDLFRHVSVEIRESVWKHLDEETKSITKFLLRFDYDDAAGIMTPQYVKVRPDITVAQTIAFIRSNINTGETIYYIYIIDAIGRLQGVVSLRDLFRQKDNIVLHDFMNTKIYSVHEDTDKEETANLLQQHDLLALPVVDDFNRLLGIVTVDDAMHVLDDEFNEDMLQMGALASVNKHFSLPYLKTNVLSLFKSRIPWLAILLLAGTLTSNVINHFFDTIYMATYLIIFLPVITSTGGNTATQSSTLMIRGLSRNEIEFRHILSILLKEVVVAFLLGISLACIMLIRSLFFPPSIHIAEALVLSASLVFVVLFSAVIGTLAPLIISKLGTDPTVIASPLIATLIDLIGLAIYFSMARMLLG